MKGRSISPRQAIAGKCKECTYDTEAAGNWRQQTASCPVVHCALWTFRPLHGNAPAWLAARDAATLPDNWRAMPYVEAIAVIAGKVPNGCEATPFQDSVAARYSNTPAVSHMPPDAAYEPCGQGDAI